MDRSDIVKEAREWIGTKWQHQGAVKGVGCDCAGLVRGVYKKLTGRGVDIPLNYPATWHLFKEESRMYDTLSLHAGEEILLENVQAGDIVTFSFRDRFPDHHVGIATGEGTFVHAYMDVKHVVETRLDKTWQGRLRHAFRFPGVD